MKYDLMGREIGPARDNPELAAFTAFALGVWEPGEPLPWMRRTRPEATKVALRHPGAPRQPWDPLPLDRAA